MEMNEILNLIGTVIIEKGDKLYVEREVLEDILIDCNLSAGKMDNIMQALDALGVEVAENHYAIDNCQVIEESIEILEKYIGKFSEEFTKIRDKSLTLEQNERLNILIFKLNLFLRDGLSRQNKQDKVKTYSGAKTKITFDMIKICYEYVKKYYRKSISLFDAKEKVAKLTGMNDASAQMYINAVKHMLEGVGIYKKSISSNAYEVFFDNIFKEFGMKKLKTAIAVAEEHLDWLEDISGSPQNKARGVCEKYSSKVKAQSQFS